MAFMLVWPYVLCFLWSTSTTVRTGTHAAAAAAWTADQRQVRDQLGYVPSNYRSIAARCADGTPLVLQTYPLQGGSPRRQARSEAHSWTTEHDAIAPTTQTPPRATPPRATPPVRTPNKPLGTPFPTLYWLCHAKVGRAIADLERTGHATRIRQTLSERPDGRHALGQAHRRYAQTRWASLRDDDRAAVTSREGVRVILQESGVAGSDVSWSRNHHQDGRRRGDDGVHTDETEVPSVKCLHAHYAHYRAEVAAANLRTDTAADTIQDSCAFNPVGALVHELLQQEFPTLVL